MPTHPTPRPPPRPARRAPSRSEIPIHRLFGPEVPGKYKHPAAIEELEGGDLLLVRNDSFADRTPLTVAISTDGDRTYPHRRNIAGGPGEYADPFAIQARDGKIHLVYTSDERTVIRPLSRRLLHCANGAACRRRAGAA